MPKYKGIVRGRLALSCEELAGVQTSEAAEAVMCLEGVQTSQTANKGSFEVP